MIKKLYEKALPWYKREETITEEMYSVLKQLHNEFGVTVNCSVAVCGNGSSLRYSVHKNFFYQEVLRTAIEERSTTIPNNVIKTIDDIKYWLISHQREVEEKLSDTILNFMEEEGKKVVPEYATILQTFKDLAIFNIEKISPDGRFNSLTLYTDYKDCTIQLEHERNDLKVMAIIIGKGGDEIYHYSFPKNLDDLAKESEYNSLALFLKNRLADVPKKS